MGINAHRAFHSTSTSDNYLVQLTVDEDEKATLRKARDEIRDTLRSGFQNWSEVVERGRLFEVAALTKFSAANTEPTLSPKFKMQGSWSYATLNCTTHEPPQEIDLDDGIFLPVSFLTQNGSTHPAIVSDAYFTAVQAMVAPLCREKGWKLVTDKSSCVRVEIRTGAHIDLALYAIPDEDFRVLVEKVEAAAARKGAASDQDLIFDSDIYPHLPDDHIMLAHRKEGWKPSDPRKLEDWFQAAIDRHGYQLRRVCRYLKAWRDYHWKNCRLSSIALMACAVTAFDEAVAAPNEDRDDKALLMVAECLPNLLGNRIRNPVVDEQFLDEGWTDCRADFVAKAQLLSGNLSQALGSSNAHQAMVALGTALGDYMPEDVSYYVVETAIGAPTILSSGILKGLGDEPDARAAVKLGGDDRYG